MNPYYDMGIRCRRFLSSAWRNNWIYVRRLMFAALAIVAIPPIERYWLPRMPVVPAVPISVLVFIAFSSIFMMAAAAVLYVLGLLLLQISRNERSVPGAIPSRNSLTGGGQKMAATGGAFIPAEDETLWLREQFDMLKQQGVLTETDGMDIETMAKELGLKVIMEQRGKTE